MPTFDPKLTSDDVSRLLGYEAQASCPSRCVTDSHSLVRHDSYWQAAEKTAFGLRAHHITTPIRAETLRRTKGPLLDRGRPGPTLALTRS
jgi:hypothetical protein